MSHESLQSIVVHVTAPIYCVATRTISNVSQLTQEFSVGDWWLRRLGYHHMEGANDLMAWPEHDITRDRGRGAHKMLHVCELHLI